MAVLLITFFYSTNSYTQTEESLQTYKEELEKKKQEMKSRGLISEQEVESYPIKDVFVESTKDEQTKITAVSEYEVDAGEDQYICSGSSVTLNGDATVEYQPGGTIYEANNASHFSEWTAFYSPGNLGNPWSYTNSNNAGGNSPEIRYYWVNTPSGPIQDTYIRSPEIDLGMGTSNLELSFKHYLSHYASGYNYSISVELSTDGNNWNSVYSVSPVQSSIPAQTINININEYDGTESLYIRYRLTGNDWGIFYWYIDDIKITGTEVDPPVYTWEADGDSENPVPNNILNPTVSPTETTTYTLTVEYDDEIISDSVTIYVAECLDNVEICPFESVSLNDLLPSGIDSNSGTWYEDENGSPNTNNVVNTPEAVNPGTYWFFYNGEYWKQIVLADFSEECLECTEDEWEYEYYQSEFSNQFNAENNIYAILDFYKIGRDFRVLIDNINTVVNPASYLTPNFSFIPTPGGGNVRFFDSATWDGEDIDLIVDLEGAANQPILRIIFGPNGLEGFYGSRVSAGDPDYELEPLELFNGASFNSNINWNDSGNQEIKIQKTGSAGPVEYSFKTLNIIECPDPCIEDLSLSVSEEMICEGDSFQLIAQFDAEDLDEEDLEFAWTGPNDFVSTEQNPNILDASLQDGGEYQLIITAGEDCEVLETLQVDVLKCHAFINPHIRQHTQKP